MVEPHHAALGLRDDLLRQDDDVPLFDCDALRHELAEIHPRLDLRQAVERQDRQRHARPVTRRPTCALYRRFTAISTVVIASNARAERSGPASTARPASSFPASSTASAFASPSSPQTSASSSVGSSASLPAASECSPAATGT